MVKSTGSSTKERSAESPGTNKDLATIAGASSLPAFMQQDAASNAGKENISRDDMVIPRVALMQAVSPEVTEGKAEVGHFYHTVLEEDLGETLDIIIVHHSKRYTFWNPRHLGGGVLARASDGQHWDADWEGEIAPFKDMPRKKIKYSIKAGDKVGRDIGLGKWGTLDPENEDSPPAATLSHVLVCVAPDRPEIGPFVILLQRAAEPVAKQLLSKAKLDPAPIYGQIYSMAAKDQANAASQDFKQFTFAKNGHVQSAELYEFLKSQYEQFKSTEVKFDEAAAQVEVEGDGGGDGGGDDGKY